MQQDVVRAQIIALVLEEMEELKEKARADLEQLKAGDESELLAEEKEAERIEKLEVEEMFRRIRASARPGKSYELQIEKKFLEDYWRLPQRPRIDLEGDTEMEGMTVKPKTARQIREGLAQDLQILIRCALEQLDEYDSHCNSVVQPYRSSMARKTGGIPTNQVAAVSSLIETDRFKQNPKPSPENPKAGDVGTGPRAGISTDVVRLSNGMPVTMERIPVTNVESLEELTRRSKK